MEIFNINFRIFFLNSTTPEAGLREKSVIARANRPRVIFTSALRVFTAWRFLAGIDALVTRANFIRCALCVVTAAFSAVRRLSVVVFLAEAIRLSWSVFAHTNREIAARIWVAGIASYLPTFLEWISNKIFFTSTNRLMIFWFTFGVFATAFVIASVNANSGFAFLCERALEGVATVGDLEGERDEGGKEN